MTAAALHQSFARVVRAAASMRHVTVAAKYDASPLLQVHGCFMAGLALHPSAEPDTLVVRCSVEDRNGLLADAPDAYYVTAHYEPYPVVLVRLKAIGDDGLRDLLMMSWKLTMQKVPRQRANGRLRSRVAQPTDRRST
jgi:hypothetical protein